MFRVDWALLKNRPIYTVLFISRMRTTYFHRPAAAGLGGELQNVPEKLAQTNYVPKVPDSGTNLAHNVAIHKMVNIWYFEKFEYPPFFSRSYL